MFIAADIVYNHFWRTALFNLENLCSLLRCVAEAKRFLHRDIVAGIPACHAARLGYFLFPPEHAYHFRRRASYAYHPVPTVAALTVHRRFNATGKLRPPACNDFVRVPALLRPYRAQGRAGDNWRQFLFCRIVFQHPMASTSSDRRRFSLLRSRAHSTNGLRNCRRKNSWIPGRFFGLAAGTRNIPAVYKCCRDFCTAYQTEHLH